jgi:phage terminase large subunit-like protein
LCEDDRYYFDEETAQRVIDIVSCFRHTKGDAYGKQWLWLPWQYFFFAYIFGLKHKSSDLRVVRNVLLLTAKKSGKSEIAGALAVLMAFFDGEHSAECYSAANTYDQAKFCWDSGRKILQQLRKENEWLDSILDIRTGQNSRSVKNKENESFFDPLAANSSTMDGRFPHFSCIDELHEAKDNSIKENLESGSVARTQPLLTIVTTRGFNKQGPLGQLENSYIPILENKWQDDSVFPLMFTIDEGDDWEDVSVWGKANPGLGITFSLEALTKLYNTAKTEGATAEVNFKTKNLNIWTNVASVWIQDEIWTRDTTDYKDADLLGRVCFAGLDLASTRDIAAFTMLFPPSEEGEKYKQITRYYCPEEQISERSRKDRVPYEQWVAEGWLIATPGNVIDYDYIENDIAKAAELFDLQGVYYDRYNAAKVVPAVVESGIICEPFAQTPGTFNAPLKELERLAIGGMFDQGKDPIMRWMAGNVIIYMDGNGNIKFDKAKAREKIDGMVALGMAFGAYLAAKKDEESIYEKRGIIMF